MKTAYVPIFISRLPIATLTSGSWAEAKEEESAFVRPLYIPVINLHSKSNLCCRIGMVTCRDDMSKEPSFVCYRKALVAAWTLGVFESK